MRVLSDCDELTRVEIPGGRRPRRAGLADDERTVIRSVSRQGKRYALELDETGELPEQYEPGAPRVLLRF